MSFYHGEKEQKICLKKKMFSFIPNPDLITVGINYKQVGSREQYTLKLWPQTYQTASCNCRRLWTHDIQWPHKNRPQLAGIPDLQRPHKSRPQLTGIPN